MPDTNPPNKTGDFGTTPPNKTGDFDTTPPNKTGDFDAKPEPPPTGSGGGKTGDFGAGR
jgi:hypothetical protein